MAWRIDWPDGRVVYSKGPQPLTAGAVVTEIPDADVPPDTVAKVGVKAKQDAILNALAKASAAAGRLDALPAKALRTAAQDRQAARITEALARQTFRLVRLVHQVDQPADVVDTTEA